MATIIKRKNSYQVQVSNYKFGTQKRVTKTFKTKTEATHWAHRMELMKGNGFELSQWNTPFPKFYYNWVHYVKKDEVRESTFKNYERSVKIIERLFSNIKLRNLNDIIVQRKIDEYAETLSIRTVKDLLTKIKSSLRYALAKGYIQIDFTSILKPKGRKLENRNQVLPLSGYITLHDYLLNNLEDENNVYFYIILVSGLRRGEALGLRPENIHPDKIVVQESISPDSDDKGLKSVNSLREVTISKKTFDIIQSVPVKENGYIFNKDFTLSKELQKVLEKIGVQKTTLQGLRRTHASIAYTNSKDDLYISNRLGHASTVTTHTYYLELIPETKTVEDQKLLHFLDNL